MDPINVVVVERDADWTQWESTSHLIGHALLVLVQQADETSAAFRARILARLARIQAQLGSLVLMCGSRCSGLSVDGLLSALAKLPTKAVHTQAHQFGHGFMAAGASV